MSGLLGPKKQGWPYGQPEKSQKWRIGECAIFTGMPNSRIIAITEAHCSSTPE
jgi:hypothetical protein